MIQKQFPVCCRKTDICIACFSFICYDIFNYNNYLTGGCFYVLYFF